MPTSPTTTPTTPSPTTLPTQTPCHTTALTGIPSLLLTTKPLPLPLTPTQILVAITFVSLNYKDAEIVSGLFTHHASSRAPSNLIPCADSCGRVIAVGSSPSASKWVVGDRVLSPSYPAYRTGPARPEYLREGVGSAVDGCLARYRVFEADGVVRCPEGVSDAEGACLGVAGTTAWMGLRWMFPISRGVGEGSGREEEEGACAESKGKTVLIQGTGGVSLVGIQLARKMGMRVILTSGREEKLRRAFGTEALGLREGVDHAVNYRTMPEWDREVLRLTEGEGADVIFENGGGNSSTKGALSSTTRSFRCVAFGGVINSIGYVAGKRDVFGEDDEERINVNVLALAKNVTLKGLLNGPRDRFEEMLRFVEKHQIKPVIDRVFKFEEAREAMQYLWDGKHFGKVVIQVASE